MKDYSVTVTITVPITARSMAQAELRADDVANAAVVGINDLHGKWLGEIDPATYEVEEA